MQEVKDVMNIEQGKTDLKIERVKNFKTSPAIKASIITAQLRFSDNPQETATKILKTFNKDPIEVVQILSNMSDAAHLELLLSQFKNHNEHLFGQVKSLVQQTNYFAPSLQLTSSSTLSDYFALVDAKTDLANEIALSSPKIFLSSQLNGDHLVIYVGLKTQKGNVFAFRNKASLDRLANGGTMYRCTTLTSEINGELETRRNCNSPDKRYDEPKNRSIVGFFTPIIIPRNQKNELQLNYDNTPLGRRNNNFIDNSSSMIKSHYRISPKQFALSIENQPPAFRDYIREIIHRSFSKSTPIFK